MAIIIYLKYLKYFINLFSEDVYHGMLVPRYQIRFAYFNMLHCKDQYHKIFLHVIEFVGPCVKF